MTWSLDTSIVVRLLVQQPTTDYARAAVFVEKCLESKGKVFVSALVFAEAYFALQYHYGIAKRDALEMLAAFARHGDVSVAPHVLTVLTTPGLATAKPGFVDRLIHGEARAAGHALATLERAAAKLDGVELA